MMCGLVLLVWDRLLLRVRRTVLDGVELCVELVTGAGCVAIVVVSALVAGSGCGVTVCCVSAVVSVAVVVPLVSVVSVVSSGVRWEFDVVSRVYSGEYWSVGVSRLMTVTMSVIVSLIAAAGVVPGVSAVSVDPCGCCASEASSASLSVTLVHAAVPMRAGASDAGSLSCVRVTEVAGYVCRSLLSCNLVGVAPASMSLSHLHAHTTAWVAPCVCGVVSSDVV